MSILEAIPVRLSVPPVDEVLDLHGDPAHHDLALFVQGNQWMVMEALLGEFQAAHPEVAHVYYETLPPAILLQQLRQGVLQVGELTLHVSPDVLTASTAALAELADEEWLEEYHEYAANTLAILVRRGNPRRIRGWSDLLLAEVRAVLPDPEAEDIGRLVREVIIESLGPDAWTELAHRKRDRGAVRFTRLHHRETPLELLAGAADAGPVWLTEGLYQMRLGSPLDFLRLPGDQNRRGHYGAAVVTRTCTHPQAAQAFVDFLRGPPAQAVYERYGFEAPRTGSPAAGVGAHRHR